MHCARLHGRGRWRRAEEVEAWACSGDGGYARGDPVAVEIVPGSLRLSRAGLWLGSRPVRGFGVLIPQDVFAPQAHGSQDVPGLCLAGLVRALGVVVRHVGSRSCLVQLEQRDSVEEAPCRLSGAVPVPVLGGGSRWWLGAEAEHGD